MASTLFFLPFPTAFTSNGLPAAGAKLFFYEPGTLTSKEVWSDSDLSVSLGSTVTANSAGRFPTFYLDLAEDYRLRIVDEDGVELDDIDPYPTLSVSGLNDYAVTFSSDGSVYIPAYVAMTLTTANAQIGSGTLSYEKSTSAAPGTFTTCTLPATLEGGAWLKVTATGVSGFLAAHFRRSA